VTSKTYNITLNAVGNAAALHNNLVSNGGAESGVISPNVKNGWGGITFVASNEPERVYKGSYGLRVYNRGGGDKTYIQSVTLEKKKTYLMSAMAKAATDYSPLNFYIMGNNPSNVTTPYLSVETPSGGAAAMITKDGWYNAVKTIYVADGVDITTFPYNFSTYTETLTGGTDNYAVHDSFLDELFIGELVIGDIKASFEQSVNIPTGDSSATLAISAKPYNTLGTTKGLYTAAEAPNAGANYAMSYALAESYQGVSVDGANLTVDKTAMPGIIEVVATCTPSYPNAAQSSVSKNIAIELVAQEAKLSVGNILFDGHGPESVTLTPNARVAVTATFANVGTEAAANGAMLLAGLYERESNKILACAIDMVSTIAAGGTADLRANLDLPQTIAAGEYYIKAFAWDKSFRPLSSVVKQLVKKAEERILLYVEEGGNDAAAGTIGAPLATMTGARDKVRELKSAGESPKNGFVVYFREGEYNINEQALFTEQDSGTETAPIVYRSYPGEEVSITGSVDLDASAFGPISDAAIKNRIIDETARERVVTANLEELGISNYGQVVLNGTYSYYNPEFSFPEKYKKPNANPPEFFLDGKPLTIARYPNDSVLGVSEIVDYGWNIDDDLGPNDASLLPGTPFKIKIDDARLSHYADAKDPLLYGFFRYHWADQTVPFTYDANTEIITSAWSALFGVTDNAQMYFYNLLEEIDEPGEYYLDYDTGDLYFYPPTDLVGQKLQMSCLDESLIKIQNADYLEFHDFEIGTTRKEAVEISNGEHNVISNLEISNTAANAVTVFGRYNTVKNCYIHDVNGGIELSSNGRSDLQETCNQVINNHIKDYARILKTYNEAVCVVGVNDYVAYNEIHGADHLAIEFSGFKNKIYYNEIYDVCLNTNDAGAIYGGRSWVTGRGTEIKYNYFHDLGVGTGWSGVGAVFLDGGQCEVTMEGNVAEDLTRAFWVGGGWDCKVINNITVNVDNAFFMSAIMKYVTASDLERWTTELESPLYSLDELKTEFPLLDKMRQKTVADWVLPYNNYYGDNIVVNGLSESYHHTEAQNLINLGTNYVTDSDPGFYDYKNKDYRLRDDASARDILSSSFVAPPFEKMGTSYERAIERVAQAVVMATDSPRVFTNGTISFIDSTDYSVSPKQIEEEIYVPLEFIASVFDAEMNLDASSKRVMVTSPSLTLRLALDSAEVSINGTPHTMGNMTLLQDNNVYIPLDEVEALFAKKVYQNERGLIAISNTENLFGAAANADEDITNYLFDLLCIY